MTTLDEGTRIARKSHCCDGSAIVENEMSMLSDQPRLPCTGIKKGDQYHYQVQTWPDFGTWKCCKACYAFIDSNDCWEEY